MLQYQGDRGALMPHVPKRTELDERSGNHFVSLVGFLFLDTRILSLPALFHQKFEEVNLRFYVRRVVANKARAGVVFLREMVPLPLVSQVARLTYNEPYRTDPM